jgi:hypothetical protein
VVKELQNVIRVYSYGIVWDSHPIPFSLAPTVREQAPNLRTKVEIIIEFYNSDINIKIIFTIFAES